jgi:hypothetical protein
VKRDGKHHAAVRLLDHLRVAGDGALVGMAAPVDRELVQLLEALAGMLVRRGLGAATVICWNAFFAAFMPASS